MHIHNVYFWLTSGLDDESLTAFEQGLLSLAQDPQVQTGYYGKPADTQRDVVENSYSYGLVLVFDDIVAHDLYQVGANHLSFVDEHLSKWVKVIVHDIQT
ncbi:MAG: Dabb family protein [Chloroflexi bacterium]|nr:Dabb family protein [Chloroflexota bacterium]